MRNGNFQKECKTYYDVWFYSAVWRKHGFNSARRRQLLDLEMLCMGMLIC